VNYLDKDGNTDLHLTAYYGHADVVAKLLDRGPGLISDVTRKNQRWCEQTGKWVRETALDCAKGVQEAYGKATDKTAFCPLTVDVHKLREKDYESGFPITPYTRVDLTTRNGSHLPLFLALAFSVIINALSSPLSCLKPVGLSVENDSICFCLLIY